MTFEHFSAYFSYQYSAENLITSRIRSNQIIDTPNGFNLTESLDILGYGYDDVAKRAFIVELDGSNLPVIESGKVKEDAAQTGKRITLSGKESVEGVPNRLQFTRA